LDWFDPTWIETLRLGLLGRLALAALLGGIVGLERELSSKPAGLRTNILICVGATVLMELSQRVAGTATVGPADPGRIAAQVVSGIGFIGAGTILVHRGSVVGLTTAATLWVVAAVGLAVGAHAYVEAVGTTALVVLTLIFLGRVEGFLFRRRTTVHLEVTTDPDAEVLERVVAHIEGHGLRAKPEKLEKQRERFRAAYEIVGRGRARDAALRELASLGGVRRITVH
jgi:putative Mg2+ transporter-C (MgtC) family protein